MSVNTKTGTRERPITSGDVKDTNDKKGRMRPGLVETLAGGALAAGVAGIAMNACSSGPDTNTPTPTCERLDNDGDGVYECTPSGPLAGHECRAVVTRTRIDTNDQADAEVADADVSDADQSADADAESAEAEPTYVEEVSCEWVSVEGTDGGVSDADTVDADESVCQSNRECQESNSLHGESLSVSSVTNEDGETTVNRDEKSFGPLTYSVTGFELVTSGSQTVVAAVLTVVDSCGDSHRVELVPEGEGTVRDGDSEFVFSCKSLNVDSEMANGTLEIDVEENCNSVVDPDAGPDADLDGGVTDGSPDADQTMDADAEQETDADLDSADADEETLPDAEVGSCERVTNGSGPVTAYAPLAGEEPVEVEIADTGVGVEVVRGEFPFVTVRMVSMDTDQILSGELRLSSTGAGAPRSDTVSLSCGGVVDVSVTAVWGADGAGTRADLNATVRGVAE